MSSKGRKRIIIEHVTPEVNCGRFAIKRVIGDAITVQADVFGDGHDVVQAALVYRNEKESEWHKSIMQPLPNDRWQGSFRVQNIGHYFYTIQGWIDHFGTWKKGFAKKYKAGQDVRVELMIAAELVEKTIERASDSDTRIIKNYASVLRDENPEKAAKAGLADQLEQLMATYPESELVYTYNHELRVVVDSHKALYSTWYEFFPRSFSEQPGAHGTFKECERLIPRIAEMGFDVIYLPPIHPIGETNRKGRNNSPHAEPGEPGSPWAIGSKTGGHKAVHPQLGTIDDFEHFVQAAKDYNISVALDIAFQCSPDHPYVKEHPEWFYWRPDGTIQYAENPPKKYQDVLPLNFETGHWRELWDELKDIALFWLEKGVRIFRIDNPHTKPLPFWEWLIAEIKKVEPEAIFLAEAFTRPKVKYGLAKLGFSQSYTYFTWRHTKQQFIDYLTELTKTEVREYCRPNFWPNTPDILPEHLQFGGRPVFMARLVMAATMSSNYGIYGPAFELCVTDAVPGKEEYLYSEKYEIKQWHLEQPGNLTDFIARVNQIRNENPALQDTFNITFYETDNDYLLAYGKTSSDLENIIVTVINLDPYHTQSGFIRIPVQELDIPDDRPYLAHELLSNDKYIWQGEWNYLELNPKLVPAHILQIRRCMRREQDFDYFM